MRTSIKNIFACGDVCTAGWTLAEHWFQVCEDFVGDHL
jgi:thioredoxin reductase